ncbi:hypothetical protein JAAARDRAFT_29062 [Jaapia argillacea MUCL 33604]|uniref:RRM domain-containing protein n=1 Tax=Jaapia argillacea MUCL 33604 TaxID=933084 RepID=A0A067Q7X6_9AGAM|nr:hypothetical protein JAAARDRAFT_29062 [Jaapia argillacea MUCL 33604]
MAASLSALSASVTRILSLTGFPKELKTKDIQATFSEWETVSGGFKIKWVDDTSLLLVFADPTAAKRAYLNTLAFPPPSICPPNSDQVAIIKPYDGPDAQNIIQTVNSRHTNGRGHNVRASSVSIPSHHSRPSISTNGHAHHHHARNGTVGPVQMNTTDILTNGRDRDREPSPTLPSIPSHPTLSALIGESISSAAENPPMDPAILATSLHPDGVPPRIGDPGKRMLGHALGVRHPGLGPRILNGHGAGVPGGVADTAAMKEVQRVMASLAVGE